MKSERVESIKKSWLILAAVLVLLAAMLPADSQPETLPAIYNPVKVLTFFANAGQ